MFVQIKNVFSSIVVERLISCGTYFINFSRFQRCDLRVCVKLLFHADVWMYLV